VIRELTIDPEVNIDGFVKHDIVQKYMNIQPTQSAGARWLLRQELQKKEEDEITKTEVTPRTEVEPCRSGDHQEREELLRPCVGRV
jgi:hypothetical protein